MTWRCLLGLHPWSAWSKPDVGEQRIEIWNGERFKTDVILQTRHCPLCERVDRRLV